MARLRNIWALAAASVASLGIGLALLLGGALGTTAATGASPTPAATAGGAEASTLFGCRASLARVSLGGTTALEPVVANGPANPPTDCLDDNSGEASPIELGNSTFSLGSVGPASVETYETGALGSADGPGVIAETTVTGVSLNIGGYTLSVAGPLTSFAAAECTGTTLGTQADAGPSGSASSDVLKVTSPTGATVASFELGSTVNEVVGNLPAALSALISITANEQTVTATSLTERLFDIKLVGASAAQIVIGEATVNYPNTDVCSGNTPPTGTTTTVTSTTSTTVSAPGTTVTQPGSVTTITGANGTATTVTTGGPTTIIEPTGTTPPSYLQECADGSTLDPATGDCVIVYDGQTIYVSKPFKGPVGGTVYSLGQAMTMFKSSCLSGAGPDFVFVVSKSDIDAMGTPSSDRILITGSKDHVAGLAGDDCIDGQGSTENITDGNGKDRIYVTKGVNRVVAGNGPNTIHGGNGRNWITDGTGDDYIYGGSLHNRIDAYGNHKHIYGGKSDDRIWTNSVNAVVSCGGGKANILFAREKVAKYAKKHGCQKIKLLK